MVLLVVCMMSMNFMMFFLFEGLFFDFFIIDVE